MLAQIKQSIELHPGVDRYIHDGNLRVVEALAETVHGVSWRDAIAIYGDMQAQADDAQRLQKLVLSRWKLNDLRQRYRAFNERYRGIYKSLKKNLPDGQSMLLLRVLLIHEYRRILLSDPELPAAMLPADWDGYIAQSLTAELYPQLVAGSTEWVNQQLNKFQRISRIVFQDDLPKSPIGKILKRQLREEISEKRS